MLVPIATPLPFALAAACRARPLGWLVLLWVLTLGTASFSQIPEDPCVQGKDLYRQAQFDEARVLLRQCLDSSGESVEVLLPLTVMAIRAERLGEGLDYGARAVAVAPDDAEARYWYGRALLRSEKVAEARSQWQTGLGLDLTHNGILEGLARLSLADGKPAQAYQLLVQIRRQGVNESWLHRLLADLAASTGSWSESLGHLRDAMALDGPKLQDLLGASELSILAGDRDGAVAYCRRAVALEPGPAAYGGLGEAFFAVEAMDSALVYLRLAVENPGANPRFHFNLANALEVSGLLEEAETHFQIFLAQVPDDPVGRFNYGIHLDRLGRREEGLREVTRAIELDPGMLSARVVRAQMLENAADWDEAMAEVARLQELDPENSAELQLWSERLNAARELAFSPQRQGKIHLLHMVIAQDEVLEQVQSEMAQGADFAALTVRFSTGPAASRGGDIGWIDPQDMVEPLRSGIIGLAVNEISPPLAAKGVYHLFKRIP